MCQATGVYSIKRGPRCAARSGAAQPPRRFCAAPTSVGVDAGSPCVGRPESIPSKGVPAALRAVGNKRERAAGAVQERKRQGANRGISAEMQCGTAPRAARDLTGEPCSPVNPFFLDERFGLGEGASHALGGVSGRISSSCRMTGFPAPTIFLWYRQAAPSRAAKPPRCFCAAPTSVGVRRREPVCRATGVY